MTAALVGVAAAAGSLVLVPAPAAARILLAAPLIVVPCLLARTAAPLPRLGSISRLAGWPALVAAVPLVPAFALEPGPLAVALALPWLLLGATVGAAAAIEGVQRLPDLRRSPRSGTLAGLAGDAALGYLAIGAAFLALDRAGVAPLGFSAVITLLTAVHFHFVGFGLLLLACLLARNGSLVVTAAAFALALAMPLTALGFLLRSDAVGALGAFVVVVAAVVVAAALARRRILGLRAAALALALGAPLGLAWAAAPLLGATFIDLELMVRIHGGLNATAVVLAAVALPGAEA